MVVVGHHKSWPSEGESGPHLVYVSVGSERAVRQALRIKRDWLARSASGYQQTTAMHTDY